MITLGAVNHTCTMVCISNNGLTAEIAYMFLLALRFREVLY